MTVDFDSFRFRRYSCTRQVVDDWGDRLTQLRGQRLLSVHAQWESAVPGSAGWWVDGAVFLTFESAQLELGARCHEFSVSLDTCRFDPGHVSGEEGDAIVVVWREFPWPEIVPCRGQPLLELAAVEGHYEDLCLFKGLSFDFGTTSFCFFDAGDQLGVTWAPLPNDPTLRWDLGQRF
jgi:hypothetical protein